MLGEEKKDDIVGKVVGEKIQPTSDSYSFCTYDRTASNGMIANQKKCKSKRQKNKPISKIAGFENYITDLKQNDF